MSPPTTHHHRRRHNLAPSDPKPHLDPTPQYTSSAAAAAAYPHPDPPSSATIQHISNHFSKLYTNHKQLSSSTPYPHPSLDTTHLQQPKSMAISHSSAASLTKSHSQRTPNSAELGTKGHKLFRVKKSVEEFDQGQEIKREILNEGIKLTKKDREMECFERMEIIKKPYALNGSRNQENGVKELHQQEYEMVKRQSLSSSLVGGGGRSRSRRRSFCSSQAELTNFLSCNGVKIVSVDMPPFMQIHAVDCARKTHDSLEKFTAKTLALTLKKEFDGVYGPAWHCIVGTSFGSFVTHSVGGFLYFSMDHKHYVLLFKTTVQKAS